MLRGRMRSIESHSPGSTITSSAGQRNQSNSSRPNDLEALVAGDAEADQELQFAF